jgi:hypothetical protein
MLSAGHVRNHLIELVVVFVGVALAFGVENLREELNERSVGAQYLRGFRQDLSADLEMLRGHKENLRTQLANASKVLGFFEGRPIEPQAFFEAYWPTLFSLRSAPNRNTMNEVLNSGNLRLIRDDEIRTGLLDLYATYDRISETEEHVARDFDEYLYDPTFSTVRFQPERPWADTPVNRRAVEILINDVTIENWLRLAVANLETEGGLLELVEAARLQVEALLQTIPAE